MAARRTRLKETLRAVFSRRSRALLGATFALLVAATSLLPLATVSAQSEPPREEQTNKPICDEAPDYGINFFLCAGIDTVSDTIKGLDTQILCLLKIRTNRIFNDGAAAADAKCITEKEGNDQITASSNAYQAAWSAFRTIAFALMIIIGLIMIVSQILDLDIVSAYTIRKTLPKLAVAAILVAISWEAMNFVFNMSNAAADGIRALIAAPFKNIDAGIGLDGGDITLAALMPIILTASVGATAGVVALLGVGGVMALLGSAALAVISAWILLEARDVIAAILIIGAPVAIVCAVFEPFKKLYTLWKTTLLTILLSVPLIAAILQLTHVGALISFVNDQTAPAVIILVAGYVMIWGIFKQIDSVAGNLGNIVSKATGGAQEALSGYRKNTMKQRFGRYTEGRLFKEDGAASVLNKSGLAAGAFMRAERKGELLNRATLRSAMTTQQRLAAMRQANTDEAKLTQYDDPQLRAQMFASETAAREGLARVYGMNTPQIDDAIAAARANGGFSRANQIRAYEAAAASGTTFNNWNDALTLGAEISGDNETIRSQLSAMLKQRSVAAGRVDFGAGIKDIIDAMGDVNARSKNGQKSSYLDGQELTVKAALGQDPTSIVRGKPAAIKNIASAVEKEIKNQNIQALSGDTEAEAKLAIVSEAVHSYMQNAPYASMDSTVSLRNNLELPTREIRANVERAMQPEVIEREPIMLNGQHVRDTAGNRLYSNVVEEVPDPQNPSRTITRPKRVDNVPNPDFGEFGYNTDARDQNSITNVASDLRRARAPYDPNNPANPRREQNQ